MTVFGGMHQRSDGDRLNIHKRICGGGYDIRRSRNMWLGGFKRGQGNKVHFNKNRCDYRNREMAFNKYGEESADEV